MDLLGLRQNETKSDVNVCRSDIDISMDILPPSIPNQDNLYKTSHHLRAEKVHV